MHALNRILFVLAALVLLAGLAGCVEEPQPMTHDDYATLEAPITTVKEGNSCRYNCKPCPAGQVCTQVCEVVGNCTNRCDVVALCAPGHVWDSTSCSCRKQVGNECGDTVCPAGKVCCNDSCGICTDPGGFCTLQYCADTTTVQ